MRFWQELWHPKLKCERVGHKTTQVTKYWIVTRAKHDELLGLKGNYHFHCVAYDMKSVDTVCSRCGEVISTDWKEVNSIQSLDTSVSEWDELNEKGMLKL